MRSSWACRSLIASKTRSSGMGMSVMARIRGELTAAALRCKGKIFWMYQRPISGMVSSCSVAPVGAASMMITS